jgi:RimJ/RimL family protein N-acetyltransferase
LRRTHFVRAVLAGARLEALMSEERMSKHKIRKLWPAELGLYREHMLRLDQDARRLRFGRAPSDEFIETYAAGVNDLKSLVFAYVDDGIVRAAAELRPLGSAPYHQAEAAFSVEQGYRDEGIGTELMARVIQAARNRAITRIYLNCLLENKKMRAIAKKFDAVLRINHDEVFGELAPATPTCFSIWHELIETETDFVAAVLDLQKRLLRAA